MEQEACDPSQSRKCVPPNRNQISRKPKLLPTPPSLSVHNVSQFQSACAKHMLPAAMTRPGTPVITPPQANVHLHPRLPDDSYYNQTRPKSVPVLSPPSLSQNCPAVCPSKANRSSAAPALSMAPQFLII